MQAETFLDALAEGATPIAAAVAVVVAHPDDETIGAGAQFHRLRRLTIVHATDGAPRDMHSARAAGFAQRRDYARARRRELRAALAAGDVRRARLLVLEIADRETYVDFPRLIERLGALFDRVRPEIVLTHPYEGGHPDHDAVALAVQATSPAPIVEMTFYHRAGEALATGTFLPGGPPVRTIILDEEGQARKRRMIDAFTSQRAILEPFGTEFERFRVAPRYDFRLPPHEGPLWYDRFDWGITGESWRRLAASALAGRQAGAA